MGWEYNLVASECNSVFVLYSSFPDEHKTSMHIYIIKHKQLLLQQREISQHLLVLVRCSLMKQ